LATSNILRLVLLFLKKACNMRRPNRKIFDVANNRSVVCSRTSRDASLLSIKKINTLGEEALVNVELRALF